MSVFDYLASTGVGFTILIAPIILTWRIVARATRNHERLDKTVRIGKYIIPGRSGSPPVPWRSSLASSNASCASG